MWIEVFEGRCRVSELYCKVLRHNSVLQVFKPAGGWKLLGLFRGGEKASVCASAPQLPLPNLSFPFHSGRPLQVTCV